MTNISMNKHWFVYLLECCDGSYYCGITKDVALRLKKHNEGKGAKYTRSRKPCKLLFYKGGFTCSEAMKCEIAVKKQAKHNKIKYLREYNEAKRSNDSGSSGS